MEEKRRGRISSVDLPVEPMRSMPLERILIVRKKLTLLVVLTSLLFVVVSALAVELFRYRFMLTMAELRPI
jgi:hypothetical protein